MIKPLFSKVSGNVYDGDHVDHVEVEVEQNLLDHSNDQDRTYEEEVVVEQNLLDHPKDQDQTHDEEVVEVRSEDQDQTHDEEVVEVRSEDQELVAIPLLKEEAEAHNDVHDQNLLKMKYRHHQSRSPYQLAPEKSGLK